MSSAFVTVRIRTTFALLAALATASCIWVVHQETGAVHVDPVEGPTTVSSPLKVFLADGSVVFFPTGARVSPEDVRGTGTRYTLGFTDTFRVAGVGLDSVIGIEAFQGGVNGPVSFMLSAGATVLGAAAAAGLTAAIFGSCPTFYASSEQGGVLQAEAFSYSISPLMEARDVDRLGVRPDSDGVVRLEIRNEALETHYINHLEILAIEHEPGGIVVPGPSGALLSAGERVPPTGAFDRDGRSRIAELVADDDRVFSTREERIVAATQEDSRDWIDLTFPHPGSDTAIVILNLRNSLLNTVLFYDLMLSNAGAEALDWLGRDVDRIDTAVELGSWFQETMGLTVEVHDGTGFRPVSRVADTGPIAWKQVGVRVPAPAGDFLRVRLSFLVDEWRIDRVALALPAPATPITRVPLKRWTGVNGGADSVALSRLSSPDDEYMVTYPGTSRHLEFEVPAQRPGVETTYLLSSQGYYTEWVRSEWLAKTEPTTRFEPNDGTIPELLALWMERKDTFEAAFFGSKIPVR